jgi:hypothetical protein
MSTTKDTKVREGNLNKEILRVIRDYCLGFRIFTLEFAAFRQQGHRVHQIL